MPPWARCGPSSKGSKEEGCVGVLGSLPFFYCCSHIGFVANQEGRIRCIDHCGKFLFYVFPYDNGPDYPSDGLIRIVDEKGLIGYEDT